MKLRTKRIWAGIGIALIVILISGGILGGIAWARGWFNNDEEVDVDDLEEGTVTDPEGLDTASLGVSCYNIPLEYYDDYNVPYTADSAYLVTATLTGNIVDPVLYWSVTWNGDTDDQISDYFTLQVSEDTWQCIVICEQPFGTQAVLKVERNSDANKYCEIYLDYLASVSAISFNIDLAGTVTDIVPSYTTGTVYPEINLSSNGVVMGTVSGATLMALDQYVIEGLGLSATAVNTGSMEYGTDVDANADNYVTYFTTTYDCADKWNAVVSFINDNLDYFIQNLTVDFTVSFDITYGGEILKTTTAKVTMHLLTESASVEMKDDGDLSVDTGGIIFGGSESSNDDASTEYYPGMTKEEYDAHFLYNVVSSGEDEMGTCYYLQNSYCSCIAYCEALGDGVSITYLASTTSDFSDYFLLEDFYIPAEIDGMPVVCLENLFAEFDSRYAYFLGSNVFIPYSVTTIGYGAFAYCTSLVSITIPNSVTTIDDCAFVYCTSLDSITIPNSVTSIGYGAFMYCSSLDSITIPNSVTTIDVCAFVYCTSLDSITIPNSVTSIGFGAFAYCTSLETIYFDGTSEELVSSPLSSYTFGYDVEIICLQ